MSLLSLENPVVPEHYALDLEIDPTKPNFKGTVTITLQKNSNFSNNIENFQKFKLHGKDLVITSAIIDDKYSLAALPANETQSIEFTSDEAIPLNNDVSYILKIDYLGKINDVKTSRDKTIGLFKSNFMNDKKNNSDNFVIATHLQPFFARLILPCIDEPSIKSTFSLSITTLKRFQKISVSRIQSSTEILDNKDNERTVFEKTQLLPTSLFGFVIGDLDVISMELPLENSSKKLPISVFAPLNVTLATYTIDIVQKYLPLLQNFFDCPFPSNKLDFVLLPFLNDMVMENFSMITIQMDFLLLSPQSLAMESVRNQTTQLVVHELVHQWMGNYISFNSWEHLSFNESFATFLSYYLISKHDQDNNIWASKSYLENELNTAMVSDSDLSTAKSIHETYHSQLKKLNGQHIATNDIFNPISYQKGVAMLRTLQLAVGEDLFQDAISKIFKDEETFHNVPIRPMDIFHKMGQILKSENITNFVSSWTRIPGLPIVSVTTSTDESTKTLKSNINQHRFFSSENIDPEFKKESIEDIPFHITLLSQLPDNSDDKKNVLMTDRSLNLDYQITLLNRNSQGYYRVSYESQECYDEICKQLTLGNISDLSLFKVFRDLSFIIGNKFFQLPIHLKGIIQILNHIASSPKDVTLSDLNMWKSLSEGLSLLQTIVQAAIVHNRQSIITKITKLVSRLSENVNDWSFEKISQLSDIEELNTLSKIIALTSTTKQTQELCGEFFKHIRQGPKNSIPIEVVSSIYMTISYQMTSIKDWKKLFELVKTSSGIASHISDSTSSSENEKIITLQNLAITNLGFVTTNELIAKLLNFINTNITATGIENAFIGVNYNAQIIVDKSTKEKVRDIVWKWFKLHYSQWQKTLGKENAGVSGKLEKIAFMVLQMFVESPKMVEKFDQFEAIKPVWESLQAEDRSNMTIIEGFTK